MSADPRVYQEMQKWDTENGGIWKYKSVRYL